MCFRIFNIGQIKIYFVETKTSKTCFIANVNVYRYGNLIKTDNYFSMLLIYLLVKLYELQER